MDNLDLDREILLETALLTAGKPLSLATLSQLWQPPLKKTEVEIILQKLARYWQGRGLLLLSENKHWRFSIPAAMINRIPHLRCQQKNKYSRAVLEVLTIIALKQPLTRGDIEEIRGVAPAANIMQILQEQNWIVAKGKKEALGRPTLWGTTAKFLADFSLKSLTELADIK